MEYYLVKLSWTSAAWLDQLALAGGFADATSTSEIADQRLGKLKDLLNIIGGKIVNVAVPSDDDECPPGGVIMGKFIPLDGGGIDLISILAFPNPTKAAAFKMVLSTELGIKNIEVIQLLPFENGLAAMRLAHQARAAATFSSPGSSQTP